MDERLGKTYFVEVTKYRKEQVYVEHAESKEEALRLAMNMMPSEDDYMDCYSYDAEIKYIGEKDAATGELVATPYVTDKAPT